MSGVALFEVETLASLAQTVILGPLILTGIEVPENMRYGGAQRIATHKLLGGARVLDTMGRDDFDIEFSGVFSDQDAVLRAKILDALRVQGAPVVLSWSMFSYQVIISDALIDFTYPAWIKYRVIARVIADNAWQPPSYQIDALAQVTNDLQAAIAFLPPGPAQDAAAVGLGAMEVEGAATFGTAAYGAALGDIATSGSAIASVATTAGEQLANLGSGLTAGILGTTSPLAAISSVGTATTASTTLAGATIASGYNARALSNMQGAG